MFAYGSSTPSCSPNPELISHNVLIEWFHKVNSSTKSLTHWLLDDKLTIFWAVDSPNHLIDTLCAIGTLDVLPSFRALSGHLQFTVRRDTSNEGDGACVCRIMFLKVTSYGVASHLREFCIMDHNIRISTPFARGLEFISHNMLIKNFRKSTPPQNRQLIRLKQ